MVIPTKTEAKASDHYRTPNDPALLYAWGLFVALDDKSNQQKNSHMRVRNYVIDFLFLTSFLAVVSTALH